MKKKVNYNIKSKTKSGVREPAVSYLYNQKSETFEENIYTNIPVQDLMLFGIYSVIEKNEICTFERLVKECFDSFPKVFGLKRYPQWPDTLKFDRATRSLREKGLITGGIGGKFSPGEFKLTSFGISIIHQIERALFNGTDVNKNKQFKSAHSIRSIDDKLIEYI